MTMIARHDPLRYLGDELDALRSQGLYRHLRIVEDEQRAHTTVDGRSVVNLSSNNYLGLTTHPRLRERAVEAVQQFGVGSGSVRSIAGTMLQVLIRSCSSVRTNSSGSKRSASTMVVPLIAAVAIRSAPAA